MRWLPFPFKYGMFMNGSLRLENERLAGSSSRSGVFNPAHASGSRYTVSGPANCHSSPGTNGWVDAGKDRSPAANVSPDPK